MLLVERVGVNGLWQMETLNLVGRWYLGMRELVRATPILLYTYWT